KIPPMPVTLFIVPSFDLRPHVVECPQSVLPRHLFPPLRDEVGVVEWTRLDVSGFGGGLDLIFVERLTNQSLGRVVYFNRRGSDATQDDLCICDSIAARVRSPTVREGATHDPVATARGSETDV